MHLVYPPKVCITIVLDLSWDHCNTQEKLGEGGGGWGERCIMVSVKMLAASNRIKTESTRKLSNFNFQWTKTLYHNSLENIAFFFYIFQELKM